MIGQSIRLHQRVDYSTSILTQQLYQQSLYQASNATRTIEGGIQGTWAGLTTSALFQRTETFTGVDSSQLYGSTPRLTASLAPQRVFGLPIYASITNEFSHLPYRQISNGRVTSDKSLERVFAAIRATHAKYPDQRLGQIICNAVPVPGVAGARLFYAENDDLAKLVIAYKGP